jgi:hypothetical protein
MALGAFDGHAAAVPVDDMLDDGQAEPGSGPGPAAFLAFNAIEAFGQAG